jgi:hypothetical protein
VRGKLRCERKQYTYSHERDIVPIEYRIVHQRRLVLAKGHGTLTDQGIFGYQRDVWSLPEVGGYDELVDMTQVEDIALPSTERVRALASLSADMDAPSRTSRFAIVAPSEFAFGLGRLYEILRTHDDRRTKVVRVFRSLDEAKAFLDIRGTLP